MSNDRQDHLPDVDYIDIATSLDNLSENGETRTCAVRGVEEPHSGQVLLDGSSLPDVSPPCLPWILQGSHRSFITFACCRPSTTFSALVPLAAPVLGCWVLDAHALPRLAPTSFSSLCAPHSSSAVRNVRARALRGRCCRWDAGTAQASVE